MLHMIVNTHNAESCAFRGEEEGRALGDAFERLQAEAGEHNITMQGVWVNRPSHEIFMLVDAPNAHVIEEALVRVGVVGRTHSRVLAVIPVEEA